MIELSEKILVNADIQKVWAFLVNVKTSLSFNRFHVEIKLSNNFSVNKRSKFLIIHNFGFGNLTMMAQVIDYMPLKQIVISEESIESNRRGFSHHIVFNVVKKGANTELIYLVSGTYGGIVQDLPFKPILKGVIKEEIVKIKNAIESSDTLPGNLTMGSISP